MPKIEAVASLLSLNSNSAAKGVKLSLHLQGRTWYSGEVGLQTDRQRGWGHGSNDFLWWTMQGYYRRCEHCSLGVLTCTIAALWLCPFRFGTYGWNAELTTSIKRGIPTVQNLAFFLFKLVAEAHASHLGIQEAEAWAPSNIKDSLLQSQGPSQSGLHRKTLPQKA